MLCLNIRSIDSKKIICRYKNIILEIQPLNFDIKKYFRSNQTNIETIIEEYLNYDLLVYNMEIFVNIDINKKFLILCSNSFTSKNNNKYFNTQNKDILRIKNMILDLNYFIFTDYSLKTRFKKYKAILHMYTDNYLPLNSFLQIFGGNIYYKFENEILKIIIFDYMIMNKKRDKDSILVRIDGKKIKSKFNIYNSKNLCHKNDYYKIIYSEFKYILDFIENRSLKIQNIDIRQNNEFLLRKIFFDYNIPNSRKITNREYWKEFDFYLKTGKINENDLEIIKGRLYNLSLMINDGSFLSFLYKIKPKVVKKFCKNGLKYERLCEFDEK